MTRKNVYLYADAYFKSSWEDVTLEVTMSSAKSVDVTCKTHSSQLAAQLLWLVNLVSLSCDMDCGSVVEFRLCDRWFDLQWWRSRYTLLMRPSKLSSVSECRAEVFVGFSRYGNSIQNISTFIGIWE